MHGGPISIPRTWCWMISMICFNPALVVFVVHFICVLPEGKIVMHGNKNVKNVENPRTLFQPELGCCCRTFHMRVG